MPIETSWDNAEHTIIRKVFTDRWTWTDYGDALKVSHAMMTEYDHPIGIILDLRQSQRVPPNPLPALRDMLAQGMPENWLGTAVIAGSFFVQSLARIANEGMGTVAKNVYTVPSLEEARRVLTERQQGTTQD